VIPQLFTQSHRDGYRVFSIRAFVARNASGLGLCGYVRNLTGQLSGNIRRRHKKNNWEKLVEQLKEGPPGASVDNLELTGLNIMANTVIFP